MAKITKDKKRELAHAKRRMREQTQEIKLNKQLDTKTEKKVVAHPELLRLSVLTKGVQNKYNEAEEKLDVAKANYKKSKTPANKLTLEKAKKAYKIEKANMLNEVKQISVLNRKPKGQAKYEKDKVIALSVKNVNKIYATKGNIFHALKDANLELERGSFNVILGPSGSGKTTLLNMISGLDRATSGEVIINGTNLQALTTSEITQFRRHNIGFVFQSYNLLTSLNVSDNVEVGRSLQTDVKKRQKIDALLEQMDMLHNKKKMTYELSGGQQQRVSIARALSKTPDILIGDEPTGALDHKTSAKVFEIFQRINKDFNTTVIVVTHNPAVAELANRVIHVKDGRIDKITINKKPKSADYLLNN